VPAPRRASAGSYGTADGNGCLRSIGLSLCSGLSGQHCLVHTGRGPAAVSCGPQCGFVPHIGAFIIAGALDAAAWVVRPLGACAAAIPPVFLARRCWRGAAADLPCALCCNFLTLPSFIGPIIVRVEILALLVHRAGASAVDAADEGAVTLLMGRYLCVRGRIGCRRPMDYARLCFTAAISIGCATCLSSRCNQNGPGVAILR